MRVIIYDSNVNSLQEFCKIMQSLPFDIVVDKFSESEEFIKIYENSSYDIVYIDFKDGKGSYLKDKIFNINPSQKIVSINNSFECTDSIDCEHCRKSTNNFRIFKPFNIMDIANSLKDVKCEMNYCDGKLNSKLAIIAKSFMDFTFDEPTLRFVISQGKEDILSHNSLMSLVNMLRTNNIEHSVEESFIQVSR